MHVYVTAYVNYLVQDCCIFIVDALEIPQSCSILLYKHEYWVNYSWVLNSGILFHMTSYTLYISIIHQEKCMHTFFLNRSVNLETPTFITFDCLCKSVHVKFIRHYLAEYQWFNTMRHQQNAIKKFKYLFWWEKVFHFEFHWTMYLRDNLISFCQFR